MSRQQQPEEREADGWTPEAEAEYAAYCAEMDRREAQVALPPHKRDGYAERLAEHGDYLRKAQREEMLK